MYSEICQNIFGIFRSCQKLTIPNHIFGISIINEKNGHDLMPQPTIERIGLEVELLLKNRNNK